MQPISEYASKRAAKKLSIGLNINKLVAVLCMAASAAISVAMIVWSAQAIF